jgi:hypothetical protein
MIFVEVEPPPGGELLSASCTLEPGEMRQRLSEWLALTERCAQVRPTPTGAVLELVDDEPLDRLVKLVEAESECCGFYRFSLRVSGSARELEIDAGPNGHLAVAALLSLDA